MRERNTGQIEHRTFTVDALAVEKRAEDQAQRIVGHAAVFDTVGDGGWFKEKIAPGAFKKSIGQDDVRALFNHDPNYVLGRSTAGTLQLREDDTGLFVEIEPPDTQFARDLLISIGRGDISQMSFGFEIVKESREVGEGNEPSLYTLEEVRLWDVSPVTFPFYKETDVSVKSRRSWEAENRCRGLPPGFVRRLKRLEYNYKHSGGKGNE